MRRARHELVAADGLDQSRPARDVGLEELAESRHIERRRKQFLTERDQPLARLRPSFETAAEQT